MLAYPIVYWITLISRSVSAIRVHSWPAHTPVYMWFNYRVPNDFLKKWVVRIDELKSGKITGGKYLGWKINRPQTCDEDGKFEPKINIEYPYKSFPTVGNLLYNDGKFISLSV